MFATSVWFQAPLDRRATLIPSSWFCDLEDSHASDSRQPCARWAASRARPANAASNGRSAQVGPLRLVTSGPCRVLRALHLQLHFLRPATSQPQQRTHLRKPFSPRCRLRTRPCTRWSASTASRSWCRRLRSSRVCRSWWDCRPRSWADWSERWGWRRLRPNTRCGGATAEGTGARAGQGRKAEIKGS